MFCPQCGKELLTAGRFCAHCGSALPGSDDSVVSVQADAHQATPSTHEPRDLGAADTVWKKTKLMVRHTSKPTLDIEWLWSEVDVVLAGNAVVVVAAAPVSKVYSSLETIGNGAIAAGSLVGGAFVALPLAVIAESYEKLFGKHNDLQEHALQSLFDAGHVLWIQKGDARFRYFEVNGGLFGSCHNIFAVSGVFRHRQGQLGACISVSDTELPIFSEIRKGCEKINYEVERYRFSRLAEVYRLLDDEYPYPNWSEILAHSL